MSELCFIPAHISFHPLQYVCLHDKINAGNYNIKTSIGNKSYFLSLFRTLSYTFVSAFKLNVVLNAEGRCSYKR